MILRCSRRLLHIQDECYWDLENYVMRWELYIGISLDSFFSFLNAYTFWIENNGLNERACFGESRELAMTSGFAFNCLSIIVMSDSLRPHGLLPDRLLCLWNFPGKNTGMGCHFQL